MRATFFNQPWLAQRYAPGTRLILHGKTTERGTFNVAHHALGSDATPDPPPGATQAAGEIAHYPASEGVSSTQILALVQSERAALHDMPETLGAAALVSEGLADRRSALAAMHFPRDAEERERGRERLAFEELLLTQLVFLRRRARRRQSTTAYALDGRGERAGLSERWLREGLPFALTSDQQRAVAGIGGELASTRPMQRLLMGEVGSGKTVVALYAMLRAVEHGMQAALMAPTETLAEQHFATLQRLLGSGAGVRRAADRHDERPPARGHAGQARQRRAGPARRHARPDRAGRSLPRAGGGRGRRAAPLRRTPTRGARGEAIGGRNPGAARAAHDRDADPAHARTGEVRGPRRERPARAAARSAGDRDADRRGRARAGAGIRAAARAAPSRPAGLRGVSAGRGGRAGRVIRAGRAVRAGRGGGLSRSRDEGGEGRVRASGEGRAGGV